ncbi:hypothetical protein [Clostridium estertheticum]|uniref:hypothetical protein n=1 Tax=Clostridium estertheticum TaxID=238834 RepID=UPI001CF0DF5F|nr:hypothetical protein [Clostridium estertheticum]MCB2358049.1 hypothetical protein [Clostridium estertheticum]
MYKVFNELMEKLKEIIPVDDLAYLTVKDDEEAFAFYKNDTKMCDIKTWKKFHKEEYPTIIKHIPVLTELVTTKKYVAVENTHKLVPPQKEFQVLNIYSIYLFPVVRDNKVIGFVDIPYTCNYHKIDRDTLGKIQCLVDESSEKIVETVIEFNVMRNKDI